MAKNSFPSPAREKPNERGFGLLESLIGLTIVAVFTTLTGMVAKRYFRNTLYLNLAQSRQEIVRLVTGSTDCQRTRDAQPCPSSDPIPLRNNANQPLFPNGTYGGWNILSFCDAEGIKVKLARPKSGTVAVSSTNAEDFLPHSLARRVPTWGDTSSSLFGGAPLQCGAAGSLGTNSTTRTGVLPSSFSLTASVAQPSTLMLMVSGDVHISSGSAATRALGVKLYVDGAFCSGNRIYAGNGTDNTVTRISVLCIRPLPPKVSAYTFSVGIDFDTAMVPMASVPRYYDGDMTLSYNLLEGN